MTAERPPPPPAYVATPYVPDIKSRETKWVVRRRWFRWWVNGQQWHETHAEPVVGGVIYDTQDEAQAVADRLNQEGA